MVNKFIAYKHVVLNLTIVDCRAHVNDRLIELV